MIIRKDFPQRLKERSMNREEFINSHFPKVLCTRIPLGGRVIVQLAHMAKMSKGGIALPEETRQVNTENTTLARVVSLGPLAYKSRSTAEPWPEGFWINVGDMCEVPKWGGFRFREPILNNGDDVTFVIMPDHEIVSRIDESRIEDYSCLISII